MKNQQIVLVDSAVEDWQSLAVGVKAGTEVILVDGRGTASNKLQKHCRAAKV